MGNHMTDPTPPPTDDRADLPDPPRPDPRLTARQAAFVSAYCDCRNGAEAARKAGYACPNPHQAAAVGTRLLSNAVIREAVRTALDHAWSADACTRAERVAILSKLARGQPNEPNGCPPTISESLTALRILAQMDPQKVQVESKSYVVALPRRASSVEEWEEMAQREMAEHDRKTNPGATGAKEQTP